MKGYNGVALKRPFVRFLIQNPFATEYFNWISYTSLPDEHLYSTLGTLKWRKRKDGDFHIEQRFDWNM